MTFDDDTLVFKTGNGEMRLTCKKTGIKWPPPLKLRITGAAPLPDVEFTLIAMSMMPDSIRAKTNTIYRTAVYVHRIN